LLNIRSAIRRDQIRRDAEAGKTVAQLLEIEPDFRISEWVARSGQWQAQMFIDSLAASREARHEADLGRRPWIYEFAP
jgi:hypothetical protein